MDLFLLESLFFLTKKGTITQKKALMKAQPLFLLKYGFFLFENEKTLTKNGGIKDCLMNEFGLSCE